MACHNAVLLALMVLLACHAILMESRKVMKMEGKKMASLEARLIMNALPKGNIPPSSPSDKGHDNGDNAGHGVSPSSPNHVDRNLQSTPSPAIGN